MNQFIYNEILRVQEMQDDCEEYDRRLMQPDFQEEYELDCKGRALDIQSTFNNGNIY